MKVSQIPESPLEERLWAELPDLLVLPVSRAGQSWVAITFQLNLSVFSHFSSFQEMNASGQKGLAQNIQSDEKQGLNQDYSTQQGYHS